MGKKIVNYWSTEGAVVNSRNRLRTNKNPTTVMRCCQVWFDNAQIRRRAGTGRRRGTNEGQDRRLRLMAIRDRFATSRSLTDQWLGGQGHPVTVRTVYRRIIIGIV